jgi:hypothetical protein
MDSGLCHGSSQVSQVAIGTAGCRRGVDGYQSGYQFVLTKPLGSSESQSKKAATGGIHRLLKRPSKIVNPGRRAALLKGCHLHQLPTFRSLFVQHTFDTARSVSKIRL